MHREDASDRRSLYSIPSRTHPTLQLKVRSHQAKKSLAELVHPSSLLKPGFCSTCQRRRLIDQYCTQAVSLNDHMPLIESDPNLQLCQPHWWTNSIFGKYLFSQSRRNCHS